MFFTFELSPFPLSLFNEEGMRKGTKSSLFSAFTPTKSDAVQGKNNFVDVGEGHLHHRVVWYRNMNFGDIAKSCLTYLQTHFGSNVAVVFDGYPSDVNGKSTKSAERIRRVNLHSSHEIIFNEATCPEISQEQFLAHERNKVRFIDLLKKILQKANVTVKQAVEDADVLIVETAVSVKSQYDNTFMVGENIDFLVLLPRLAPMKVNLYFRKCGKGMTPDVLYSTTSFKYKFSRRILFIHAFSGCDTTSALFGHGKTKFCSLLFFPTPGRKNTRNNTAESPNYTAAKSELQSLVLRRRKGGPSTDRWGFQVHRIAVALHLADNSTFDGGNRTGEEIRYELTTQLLHRLEK
ncbi:hypothetical protein AVEN_219057-1 [Araneus ventricosus]|uniref:Uncharacterized protein n=1 Tax=Araneus ventricosus TaxID=182803 RepID=A0A4Y2VYU6_ARAVE|nr:hypothetical protein AVEN_219057-1 [Araneus ventricosus]